MNLPLTAGPGFLRRKLDLDRMCDRNDLVGGIVEEFQMLRNAGGDSLFECGVRARCDERL